MRLRQIALVAREIEPVVADLRAVLGLEVGFHDEGVGAFGLCNEVIPIGDTFLEVVSPVEPETTAGRFLERRGGDGGYMVLLQTDDVESARKRCAELGVRIVWSADLPDISGTHLHPRDIGGAILSIDEARPPASWRWGGPGWERRVRTHVTREITGVELQAEDPEAMARRWSEVVAHPARRSGEQEFEVALERGVLRFVAAADGRGEGLSAFAVAAADRKKLLETAQARGALDAEGRVRIGGTRIDLT
jgi:hypothetical protein